METHVARPGKSVSILHVELTTLVHVLPRGIHTYANISERQACTENGTCDSRAESTWLLNVVAHIVSSSGAGRIQVLRPARLKSENK